MSKLTPAEAEAVKGSRYGGTLGGFFLRLKVRSDVRASLMAKGILGKRSHVLTAAGERLREKLIGAAQ